MNLRIIGFPVRGATHQSGSRLLVSNGREGAARDKETQMTTALTDRIVARYIREAEQRQAEHPRLPIRRDEVHAGSLVICRGWSL
jgi:hypothetical protein